MIHSVRGFNPVFGLRFQLAKGEMAKLGDLGASIPSVSASSVVGSSSGTVTVGSGLATGGMGLMASGPDATAAQLTLNAFQQLGSDQGVQYSRQNPLLGGAVQSAIGWSMISGGGGGASTSSRGPS
jgi:hypothetical protein